MYETTVANNSPVDLKILIKDQIPVSQDKEITVDVTELSGAELDEKTGILKKEYSLSKGSSRVLKLGYKVSAPKDKTVYER